jgi:hypothetical protein
MGTPMSERDGNEELAPWRERLHEIIFEADTPAGKAFDVALLLAIVLSVVVVILESVAGARERYGSVLRAAEWLFTVLFTAEYVLRLLSVRRPTRYATSFLGVVDLLAIVPTYLSLFVSGAQSLLVIRALRLLRIFRVFKIARYLGEVTALVTAIRNSRAKITVFLLAVLTTVLIMGAAMYVVEGEESGHSPRHVLGHRHRDDRGLRRHRAPDGAGPDRGFGRHGARLQSDHHSHRHLLDGAGRGGAQAADDPELSRVPARGTRR